MEKETSCINSRAILDYLKKHNVDCSSLFGDLDPEIDGLEDPEIFLRDPNNWISCSVISKLYKRAKLILHDEMAAYKMGRYATENISLGYAQRIIFKTFWSVRKALKHSQKINDRWNRNKRVELVELKKNNAVVRLHWNPEMKASKDICLYNQGAYTSLPLIWGGSPATLKEKCCYFNDAPYCEYHIKWPITNRFHEIFSRFFTSKSVLMDTIKEMEKDKKIIEEKTEKLKNEIEERKQAEEELLKVKKLESVGILAGGIAHDFNNLLTIILGNIEMAKDDIKPEVGISECLTEAEKASIQAQALTKQLITFSKGGTPIKKIGSIENLVKKTTDYSLSGSNVKYNFLILHDLWPIEFDEDQMKHAINNIIVNAVESMPDEGTVDVRAENFNITAKQNLSLLEGKYVKISIRDHGVGIPKEHLSQIFDPYFSTKEMGIQKGMGLGLATTYSIINRHGGHITVESEVGVGTTFTLFLPALEKDIRELKPIEIHEPEKPSIRTGRILVMDDEESIRNLSKQRLGRLGYESELAKNGAQAIEFYKKSMDSRKPFDAVILDLTVKGGMGGKDVIKAILKIDPKVKAIVSSGYSNDPVMTNFKEYGFTGALPKPNTKKELIEALKKIIKE